jgi:hypothetical protein
MGSRIGSGAIGGSRISGSSAQTASRPSSSSALGASGSLGGANRGRLNAGSAVNQVSRAPGGTASTSSGRLGGGSAALRSGTQARGALGRQGSTLTPLDPKSPVGKSVQAGAFGYASRVAPSAYGTGYGKNYGSSNGYGYGYGYGCGYGYGTWCPTTNWYGYGCAGWGPGWGYGIGIGIGWSSCNWSLWWDWSNCWYWGSRWSLGIGWGGWCGWGGWGAPAYTCYAPAVGYAPVYEVVDEPSTVIYADHVTVEEAPSAEAAPVGEPEDSVAAPADPKIESRSRELHSRELELAQKYVKLGDLYFRAQRYAAASDADARAIELAPEDAALHFIQSDAQFAAGDYASAAGSIRRALTRDPELARMTADKTKVYEDAKLFEEQLGRLEGHVQKQPLDGDAFLVLGYNLAFSARTSEARAAFETARRLQPSDPAASSFLDALIDRELEAAGTERR